MAAEAVDTEELQSYVVKSFERRTHSLSRSVDEQERLDCKCPSEFEVDFHDVSSKGRKFQVINGNCSLSLEAAELDS